MIHLVFHTPSRGSLVVGPAPFFRFVRGLVCFGNVGSTIARFDRHAWIVDGSRFTRIECPALIRAQLEDQLGNVGETVGPAPDFRVLNAYAYIGRHKLAKLSTDTLLWSGAECADWPVLRVEPVE